MDRFCDTCKTTRGGFVRNNNKTLCLDCAKKERDELSKLIRQTDGRFVLTNEDKVRQRTQSELSPYLGFATLEGKHIIMLDEGMEECAMFISDKLYNLLMEELEVRLGEKTDI